MTIVLRCSQCYSRLTVPDEAAGSEARCPHCGEVFEVDTNLHAEDAQQELWSSSSQSRPEPASMQPAATSNEHEDPQSVSNTGKSRQAASHPRQIDLRRPNPYSPPNEPDWNPANAQIEPGLLDGTAAFELAWGSLLANLGTLVGIHSIALLIGLGFGYVADQARESGMNALAMVIQFPVVNAVQWFLLIGLIKATLSAARGQSVGEFDEIFSGGRFYGRVLVYMLMYSVVVGIGLVMFIVPGLYLACRFWPGVHFIVDRDVSVNEAFRLSSEYTAGNLQASLVVGLYGVLALAAGILTLYIGLLFTYPLYSLLWSVAFLMITRQPIAHPVLRRPNS